jgi:predicted hydrocarbon binding protein
MLCGLAKGIVDGLSDHYREPVRLEDTACMHAGDPACRISVTRA